MTRPRTTLRILLLWTTAVACYCAMAGVLTLNLYGWLAGATALGLAALGLSLLNERTQRNHWFAMLYVVTAIEWAFHTSLFVNAKSPQPPPSGYFLAELAEALERAFNYASLMALLLAISAILLWWNWKTLPHRVAILVFQIPAAIAVGWFALALIWDLVEGEFR